MTSQGQRFRRRALRRGYKVDEVDLFLDRVEATLNAERVDSPVRSQEVHDVVFRVRFGGYDEWQVDLHLDRVERQLADQEPSDFGGDRASDRMQADRMQSDRMPVPDRLPERMSAGGQGMGGQGMGGGPQGMGGGQGFAGAGAGPGNMGPGNMGPGGGGPSGMAAAFDRGQGERDRTSMGMSPRDLPPRDMPSRDMPPRDMPPRDMPPRDMPPRDMPPRDMPGRDDRMMPPGGNRPMGPGGQPPAWPEQPQARPPQGGYPGGGFAGNDRPAPLPERPPMSPDYGNEPSFAGFEPGRRGRPDLTTEMRMPDMGQGGPSAGMPPGGMAPGGMPPGGAGGMATGAPAGEVQRIDQLRRTFQLRRFGSGYDRAEVDRLFDGVINAMSGRSTMPIDEAELDPHQFNLVPGGYFEAEVDQALREVRDIIRRR